VPLQFGISSIEFELDFGNECLCLGLFLYEIDFGMLEGSFPVKLDVRKNKLKIHPFKLWLRH